MSTYRIKEIHITESFSQLTIERRFFFMWFTVGVHARYLCTLSEAQKWIQLKHQGYPVTDYYYEK